MSIEVVSNSVVKVPLILASSSDSVTSSFNYVPYLAPSDFVTVNGYLVRVSIYISSPSSATGQSAIGSMSSTDSNGVVSTVSTNSIAPGGSSFITGIFSLPVGGDVNFSLQPASDETFLSTCSYSVCIETI